MAITPLDEQKIRMIKTKQSSKLFIVISEGYSDYRVFGSRSDAIKYAKNNAKLNPDTHWIIFSPLYGYTARKA